MGAKVTCGPRYLCYLEVTTTPLNFRVFDFRIHEHAHKTKTKPYPYANLPVLVSWMQALAKANTGYHHEREPLSWLRELLRVEHDRRVAPSQLMKHIQVRPGLSH